MADPYADWKGWVEGDFGRYSPFDARYFGWHMQRAMGTLPTPLQALEIGFGNGSFMGWLQHCGHNVTGLEANPHLVDRARAAGFAAHADMSDLPAEAHFDLIAAFDVMEHVAVADTASMLSAWARRLRPGGRILLRFPNGESPFGLWMQHGDITHVQALGLSKVRQLCEQCGLVLEHSGEGLPWRALPSKRWLGAWWAQASRNRLERRLRKMYLWPRGLDLSPNQLVVLSVRE